MSETQTLKFYNTLTRTKEVFNPIDPDQVRMYVCGPTVYDFAHIGNARPAIVFDVLFRLLRHVYGAEHVTYVRNITDVDDKINARARRDFPDLPLNEAIAKVTEKTAAQYLSDMTTLGCLEPTVQPRATAYITGMVEMIGQLIERGHAYLATGKEGREVLFSVDSMPAYGRLSGRKLEEQQAGARIAVEEHKRNPADFVLWKESDPDEPGWPGTFSENGATVEIHGRPGWHIECSVMSKANLGETFDIHGGGLDLIFPHHENEIAQSCSAHGNERMANVWMHNGFLQVEGQKMSKSLGNFFTVHELLETDKFGGRKWPGEVLRLAMLMTHYREPIDFSESRLLQAEKIWEKLSRRAKTFEGAEFSQDDEVLQFLSDDLRTSDAINRIQLLAKDQNTLASALWALQLLGIDLKPDVSREYSMSLQSGEFQIRGSDANFIREDIQSRINERLAFIKAKNWAEADRIRDELAAKGVQLKDGKDAVTGERITTWEIKA